jgi:hypothetical protein
MIFQSKISKVICFWILCISIALSVLIINQGLQGINIYRFGPNPDLYILGFCINTYEKYIEILHEFKCDLAITFPEIKEKLNLLKDEECYTFCSELYPKLFCLIQT